MSFIPSADESQHPLVKTNLAFTQIIERGSRRDLHKFAFARNLDTIMGISDSAAALYGQLSVLGARLKALGYDMQEVYHSYFHLKAAAGTKIWELSYADGVGTLKLPGWFAGNLDVAMTFPDNKYRVFVIPDSTIPVTGPHDSNCFQWTAANLYSLAINNNVSGDITPEHMLISGGGSAQVNANCESGFHVLLVAIK
jgi:hypothetical protein